MNSAIIESWIKNIGRPYDALVSEGVIPNQPLTELYPGRDWLTLDVENGVELSFWAENKCFESLYFALLESTPGVIVYEGELPKPFARVMTQSGVHATFGKPNESKGPIKMPKPIGMTGGWDAYILDPVSHPNVKVVFQYAASMAVKTLVFTMIDKSHD